LASLEAKAGQVQADSKVKANQLIADLKKRRNEFQANSRPGPEIDLAFEVRKMAAEAIQEDTRDLKLTLEAVGQEMKNVKETITGIVQNPLDVAAQKLLVPTALSIVRGLRSKKQPG